MKLKMRALKFSFITIMLVSILTLFKIPINIEAEETNSSKLSKLEVVGYENDLNPNFDSDIFEYNIEILKKEIDLNIKYETIDKNAKVKIEGNTYLKNDEGTIFLTVRNDNIADTNYKINYKKISLPKNYIFDYTGDFQTFNVPISSKYKIELWGASGGHIRNATIKGGSGAYTKGNIFLNKNTNLYIYVGESYSEYRSTQSFNGGGHGSYSTHSEYNSNGGGATDVRLVNGSWDNFDSLKSRIMVAGAGELNGITYTAGETVNAGLPNITGNFGITANGARGSNMSVSSTSGAFYSAARSGWRDGYTDGYNSNTTYYAEFNASRSSSIYGNSTTVQPNAYVVYMFKRIK